MGEVRSGFTFKIPPKEGDIDKRSVANMLIGEAGRLVPGVREAGLSTVACA